MRIVLPRKSGKKMSQRQNSAVTENTFVYVRLDLTIAIRLKKLCNGIYFPFFCLIKIKCELHKLKP